VTHTLGDRDLPVIPRVILGRTGIVSTRLGLGCAGWPLKKPYEQVVDVFRTAFASGIRHIDVAPLYGTEEIVGRALKDAERPNDMVLATKVCSYKDDLGIAYRDYSSRTVYLSVERSLTRLQVDHLSIVHIHDCEPENLAQAFARNGALRALLDLKSQGVVSSVGMATFSLECLEAAIAEGTVDHIQPYHSYTLLNQEAKQQVIPSARTRNLSVLNNAPFAGWILGTGSSTDAYYNYRPAEQSVIEAVQRLERICSRKGVSLATAAIAFSLMEPDIDVTVIGASSPDRVRERVEAVAAPLTGTDFEEMLSVAGGPFPLSSPYPANPANVDE
jgi:D-threo-aldose 1-dehydrogenase